MQKSHENVVNHAKENGLLVIWQFCIFTMAFVFGTFTRPLFPQIPSDILFKFVDVLFICGTILLAVKLAREGWDLAASGFTVLGVGWGVFFAAIDFQHMEIAGDVFTSPAYFFIPCMVLISCYKPFPLLIKVLNIWCAVPFTIILILFKINPGNIHAADTWLIVGFTSFHTVSFIWGSFFLRQYKKESKSITNQNLDNSTNHSH